MTDSELDRTHGGLPREESNLEYGQECRVYRLHKALLMLDGTGARNKTVWK
jgi:hypothetical protein